MKLGIYTQVPFCQTKCTYCNFHTGVFAKSLYAPYVNAVCREITEHIYFSQAVAATANARVSGGRSLSSAIELGKNEGASAPEAEWAVDTLYIGGGTPSLLESAMLARIVSAVGTNFRCELEEVTLEADPETISAEKAAAWRASEISRISLGAQSFHDTELKAAGRMHRRGDIFNAVRWLREAGFTNISLDLIAGLPHQTTASWQTNLEVLSQLRPEHVSVYLLEVDEGSRLGREVLSGGARYSADALPSDDAMADSYERACERLAREGYDHYEISNWALPGFRSRHNLKYWRREPYLGFGAGAHSFDGRMRWANAHDPAAYVAKIARGESPAEQIEEVTTAQALEEELFLGLRQLEGIDFARIEAQYDVSLRPRLEALRDDGLVEIEGARIRLAPQRLTVSNEVFVELLG
jgi:putative oxygen-independent coproporphyrinogen III oxidase